MNEIATKSKVSLVACDTYDDSKVLEAVKKGIDLIGGIGQFVKPGEKIILKPNVLIGASPEKCVCTHPRYSARPVKYCRKPA